MTRLKGCGKGGNTSFSFKKKESACEKENGSLTAHPVFRQDNSSPLQVAEKTQREEDYEQGYAAGMHDAKMENNAEWRLRVQKALSTVSLHYRKVIQHKSNKHRVGVYRFVKGTEEALERVENELLGEKK